MPNGPRHDGYSPALAEAIRQSIEQANEEKAPVLPTPENQAGQIRQVKGRSNVEVPMRYDEDDEDSVRDRTAAMALLAGSYLQAD